MGPARTAAATGPARATAAGTGPARAATAATGPARTAAAGPGPARGAGPALAPVAAAGPAGAATIPPAIPTHSDVFYQPPATVPIGEGSPSPAEADTIRVEYHPNSRRPPKISPIEDFTRRRAPDIQPTHHREPWHPFLSRLDFEFAEISLAAALSKKHMDELIALIRRAKEGEDTFSLRSHADVMDGWTQAQNKVTPFTKTTISVMYKKEEREYDLYTRNVWEFLEDILRNKNLVTQMEWDAHKLLPWDIQSDLPFPQKPLILILYADKTKLSSFGTAKGYPVIARCGNLPVDIRNGEGPGGGRVVGWLPIVEEEASEKHKAGFVNFKRVIWHESFRKILEPIASHSHTGVWFSCGDGVDRQFCPCVAILSSDYEEQAVMALIRGVNGLFPCPICLVPKDQLAEYDLIFPLRNGAEVQKILEKALSEKTKYACEAVLKETSLRPVKNAFFDVKHSDPYTALSFDRLHAFHSGLFGHHLWGEFKQVLKQEFTTECDKLINSHGLNHFYGVLDTSFTDGSKYEDIGKNLVLASHNVLTEEVSPRGYALLCTIRTHKEEDTYVGLQLHTTWTLADGRAAQRKFGEKLAKYRALTSESEEDSKNWNFPKVHSHLHAFDDIEAKGVSRNYNTKPNEKLHGPLKQTYRLRTNKRDVAEQILNVDHHYYVAGYMRDELDRYDTLRLEEAKQAAEPDSGPGADEDNADEAVGGGHFSLGAMQRRLQTISDIEAAHAGDPAFRNFARHLAQVLTQAYKAHDIPMPRGGVIQFTPSSKIREYRLLRVNYESMVDWRQETDILRCSPKFYNAPRYDCASFSASPSDFFGRILFMFTCTVGNKVEPMALIQPYERYPGAPSKKDIDLGLYRLQERPRSKAEFVSLHCVLRGALLVEDFDTKGSDFFVHDLVDADMFLRMKAWRAQSES
ncbi:hypothetical protein C2E23DRAFT_719166 [Lenzites betulinus]|nr:hypothetical protein C2E23DRAFT_719166 [Lenzites betulinus]